MIYVMSDIHGNKKRFDSIMRQIKLKRTDTLYILGDVIDRNPDGLSILRKLMTKPNVQMLLGNHEYMMLDALYYHPYPPQPVWRDSELRVWYSNGGKVTHTNWKDIRKATRDSIVQYLLSLPICLEVKLKDKTYILTHGMPVTPNLNSNEMTNREVERSVWYRYPRNASGSDDRISIFGHTPTSYYQDDDPLKIWHGDNLLGIDCGCAYKDGRLACLRLDDMKEFYSVDIIEGDSTNSDEPIHEDQQIETPK